MMLLRYGPLNAHKIAQRLRLNYETGKHHLSMLERNGVLTRIPKGSYGALYFLIPEMEEHVQTLSKELRTFHHEIPERTTCPSETSS